MTLQECVADPLFWPERHFGPEDIGERTGYAFPVPPGRYRVRMLFAELWFKVAGLRRFDIVLEGETKVEAFDPAEKGAATATERVFEANVADALLEIRFAHRLWEPNISAIEIERLNGSAR